jgi:lipopolysaccharide export system protein LptA
MGAESTGLETRGFQAKGFKVADHYGPPHETQIKSLLQGGKATPLAGGKTLLSDGVTLQMLSETNTLQLTVTASECLYDSSAQTASSAGPLRVESPDGKFSIEGDGWLWRQTNSSLFISNRVHTVVQSAALDAPPGAKSETRGASSESGPMEIFSKRFSYESISGQGLYQENVRVAGTNLNLKSASLKLEMPKNERQLQNAIAEQDVIIDYKGLQASGDKAEFSSRTGLVRISGRNPSWHAGPREGRGNELIIDRTNGVFQAKGNAWLKLPGQSIGGSQLLSSSELSAAKSGDSTNRYVEVSCDSYELRTNLGVFRKDVRASERVGDQSRSALNCSLMTLTFAGSNELQTLVAETNVTIVEQLTNRFVGGKAVYVATNGLFELTDNPRWYSGQREGKGDVLRVNTRTEEMLVKGNATMRLPADEFAGDLGPVGPADKHKPRPTSGRDTFAEIACKEYTLTTNSASFRGGVLACHPQMEWMCETLVVKSSGAQGSKPDSMLAERDVRFELENTEGQKVHGTGDKAVYTFGISDTVTNDLLTLTGKPASLVTTNGTAFNDRIIYNRVTGQLSVPGGHYRIEGQAPIASSNVFVMPKTKLGRP